jgi:hypothetical protein
MRLEFLSVGLLSLLSLARYVNGCGGFFCEPATPVLQAGENIAFGVEQNGDNVDVTMVVQINYEGPSEGFGWLLPVPTSPKLDVGSDILFTALFDASRPNFSFTIDDSRSTTCTKDDLTRNCAAAQPTVADGADESFRESAAGDAKVVKFGTVGPFDFVTLQAADNRPESIFDWLGKNGYDQPALAKPLVNYYAEMGMLFVALKLQKQSETGDIRPIILKYSMAMAGSLGQMNVACVPIQLTKIAATPKMPIQIYALADSRGFPVNYLDVTLDDHLIDWVGCYRSGQDCFLQDWRDQFGVVVGALDKNAGHAFVTEYAGSSDILEATIALNIDLVELKTKTTALSFLEALNDANVPAILVVHNIIERFIPNKYQSPENVPRFCSGNANVYTPATLSVQSSCVPYVDFGGVTFDATALAEALEKDVFAPARTAQAFVDNYPYLTRLYAQLDPEQMDRDPFFAFNSELDDVPLLHNATGVPECDGNGPIGLDIYVGDSDQPSKVEASLGCFNAWFRPGVVGGPLPISPALVLTSYNYEGKDARVLTRNEATGQFSMEDVKEVFEIMDTRVPNQTIPEFEDLTDPSGDSGALASLTFAVFMASLATASLFI